ncbi:MAG: CRISPR-associated protein Csx19 [bacterium]
MNTDTTNHPIVGAHVTPLNAGQAKASLDWLTGSGPPPAETHGVRFSLAHSDAGVTWGFLDEQGQWKLGASVDPALCPVPMAKSLHQLRLIGETAEILIWRGDGELQGRILADNNSVPDSSGPLCPINEGRHLRGECREVRDGFKRYVDVGGAQHLAPESFPEDFNVRHYFEQDATTGAVRIAATRLVPERLS